jgi:CheY-like chemotaxis protein
LGKELAICYVDDDEDDRMMLVEAFLSGSGVKIQALESGEDLMHYLSSKPIVHLFILDVNMHKIDGLELFYAIRDSSTYQNVPIVFYSTGTIVQSPRIAKIHKMGARLIENLAH